MSEHKQDKFLYTFTVNKKEEVEESEEKEIDGQKVKITKKVMKDKPIIFALKRANRRHYEKADMFYGVKLSEGIRAGLLTKALLLKRYRNDGGALSDGDAKYFYDLTARLGELENEQERLVLNEGKLADTDKIAKIDDIVKQKIKVLQALQSLETVNQALFAHTAETKAQIHLNNWWIVHLSYWDKEGNGEFAEFFPGETFEEKMAVWDQYDEDRGDWIIESLARFSLLIGLWNAGAANKSDFEQGEKEYASLSKRVIEETQAAVKKEQEVPIPPVGATATSEVV